MNQIVDPYQRENKRVLTAIAVGLGALMVVLVLGGGLKSLGLIGGKASAATIKEGSSSASILPLGADGTPSVLPQTAEPTNPTLPVVADDPAPALPIPTDTPMPADVRNWLEHLRKTDARRKKLASQHIGEVIGMMAKMQSAGIAEAMKGLFGDDEPPTSDEKVQMLTLDVEKKREEWKALERHFRSVRPPSECIPIQASYSRALGETTAMIIEVLQSMESASESPERAIAALTAMQGTSFERIDELAKQTDSQVEAVCEKYQTRKWFSVASDVGSGLLGKFGGF